MSFVCVPKPIVVMVDPFQPFAAIASDFSLAFDAAKGSRDICSLSGPLFPSPLFPAVAAPAWEIPDWASLGIFTGLTGMFDEIIGVFETLPVALPGFPEVPGLGISFPDLLPVDWASLFDGANLQALEIATAGLVPSPLFGTLKAPKVELSTHIQTLLYNYNILMVKWMLSVVSLVTDFVSSLDVDGLLPSLPSLTFPELPDLSTFDWPTLSALEIPFVPEPFKLTMPPNPTILSSSYDLAQLCKNFTLGFSAAMLNMLLDFWTQIKDWASVIMGLPDLITLPFKIPIPAIIGVNTEV